MIVGHAIQNIQVKESTQAPSTDDWLRKMECEYAVELFRHGELI